jgi:hypothetical protein
VDYYSLKKRVTAASATALSRRAPSMQTWCPVGVQAVSAGKPDDGATTFVELPSLAQTADGECILELENAAGAKMRVQLKGVAMPDLTALSRSFWDRRP